MKALSSSIVVASGAAIMLGGATGKWNLDGYWWMGFLVCVIGLAGWVRSLLTEK